MIKLNSDGKYGDLQIICLSNRKGDEKNVTVHFEVTDTTKWHYEPGYVKKYKRKLTLNNTMKFENKVFDLSQVLPN